MSLSNLKEEHDNNPTTNTWRSVQIFIRTLNHRFTSGRHNRFKGSHTPRDFNVCFQLATAQLQHNCASRRPENLDHYGLREFRSLTGAVQQNTMGVYELEILKMMRIKIYICEWWKLMLRPANNYYLFIIIFLPCHCHYHCVVNNNVTIGYGTISTI